jgi:uncharacterized protein DUF669
MTQNWGDLMKASGGANEPLPNGEYDCQVVKSEPAKTQNGKTMYKATFNVIAGPYTNRKIWGNFVVSPENPQALGIFFAQMATLGLDSNFFAANPSDDAVSQGLMNKYARIATKQREWNGQMRNDIASIKKAVLTGGGATPTGVPNVATPAPAPVAAPAPVHAPPAPVATPTPAPAPQPAQTQPAAVAPTPPPAPVPVAQPETPAPVEIPQPTSDPAATEQQSGSNLPPAPPALPF